MFTGQLPRAGRLEQVETFHQEAQARFAGHLLRHRDELRTLDVGLASFVCVSSIEAITHGAALYRPGLLKKAAIDARVEDATTPVAAYLRRGGGGNPGTAPQRAGNRRRHRSPPR